MNNPIHASIIIPSFNRADVLSLSLVALQRQSYSNSNYEIIVVDDGSTDHTSDIVNSIAAPNIKLISTANKGPAGARNEGVRQARGNILIFLDSDFITRKSFVANHLEAHKARDDLLISGMGHWHYLATFDFEEKIYFPGLGKFIDQLSKKVTVARQMPPGALITEGEIKAENFERYLFRPDWLDIWGYELIIRDYGESLSGFKMPWLASCGGNISVSRCSFDKCGEFDENLRYREDWEFGIRFSKAGGEIKFNEGIEAYQQFCPPHPRRDEHERNYHPYFLAKHRDMNVGLVFLRDDFGLSFRDCSDVVTQHQTIADERLKDHFESLVFNYALKKLKKPDTSFSRQNDKFTQIVEGMDEVRFAAWTHLFLQLATRG